MKNIKFIEKLPVPKRELLLKLSLSAALAIFWVIFLWNFWSRGISALGLNAAIFWLLLFGLFIFVLHRSGHYLRRDLYWIVPIALIMLSYALYDNPFLKSASLLVLPLALGIFYNQAFLPDKKDRLWNFAFVSKLIARFFSFLGEIGQTAKLYIGLVAPADKTKGRIVSKMILGLILFFVIAFTIFIPLLSSADLVFAAKVRDIYDWFLRVMALSFVYKVLVFISLSLLIFSVLAAWSKTFDHKEEKETSKNIDGIVSGIVLGGTLGLYLLFLGVQISHLWVGALPFDFKETESLVKSGFWQLFFLTAINILIYFFAYKKTAPLVQRILAAFTIASLFLLVSAGYRLGLYAVYYGFSYEKFFASYTVIYCAILFVWLISRLFIARRANIFKFLLVLFLWMYALISVFPVEQFILRANVALAGLKETKIRLFELTMLSPDVLALVKEYQASGLLKERTDYLSRENGEAVNKEFDWNPWIKRQEEKVSSKLWYEKNLLNFLFKEEAVKNEELFVVSGEFVCLPLRDENKPHDDLCVLGIKNNDDYYRLQSISDDKNNVVNKLSQKVNQGQKIEISGALMNEESDVYKTLGTIKIDSIRFLDSNDTAAASNPPDSFKADYISFQDYGSGTFEVAEYPRLESWVENGEIECDETPLESSLPLRTSKREINGQKYCVSASSEGAAGSVYTQYAYTTVIGDNVYLIQFVARYPNCDNYPEEENVKCQRERENFDLDILVDQEIERMKI